MSSSPGREPPGRLFEQQATLAGNLIGSALYGIVVVLFFQCMATLFNPTYRRGEGINWGLLSYTMVMFALATGFTATNLTVVFISLFETGFAQGGVLGSQMLAGPPILRALRITPSLMFLSISWLADGLLLYRCYVIYALNFWIIALPSVMYIGSLAMGIVAVYQSLMHNIRVTLYSHLVLPYFSVSLSLNIILTLMIAVRLVMHSKDIRAAMGAPAGINGMCKAIVAILVESSALYALSSLLVIGPWVAASDAVEISLPVLAETQVIAPLLIIQRIANKSALMSNTLSSGGIEEFEARSRGESTAGAVPRRFPVSLIGGVRVDTTVDYHQDKA